MSEETLATLINAHVGKMPSCTYLMEDEVPHVARVARGYIGFCSNPEHPSPFLAGMCTPDLCPLFKTEQ